MRLRLLLTCAMLGLVPSLPAAAQVAAAPRPPALKRLVDCRAVADQQQRLACYDREVAALDAAEARKDLVVVDREQIRKTRRTLFGLPLPDLGIFGDDAGGDEEEVTRLESKIKAAAQRPDGKWILTLETGGVWVQTDTRDLATYPRPGHDIRIRKAALGSYFANVNKQVAIRVQRLR